MQSESFLQRWMHNEHSQNELRWLFPKEKFNIVFTDLFSCLVCWEQALSIRMIDIVVTGFTLLVVVFYTLVVLLLHLYWQLNSSKESRYWCGVFYWDMQWMSDMAIYKNTIKAISWSSCCWERLRGRGDSKKRFAYGVVYKLKVRRLMFLSTVKTSGLTTKTSLRPSHHRLYFCNKIFQMCNQKIKRLCH